MTITEEVDSEGLVLAFTSLARELVSELTRSFFSNVLKQDVINAHAQWRIQAKGGLSCHADL